MSSAQVGTLLQYIRQVAAVRHYEQHSDRQLLERFATHRDEAAFAALLKRHGAMVLSVCRSVLHDLHDAEDAFQAAFLVLARKADSVHWRESVSSWLYRVAYRLAVKARASAARRKAHEKRAVAMPSADPLLDMSLRELRGVVNEELQRLPEQYRAPLILCALEERSLEEAARLLGWTKGAVKGRLQRGRACLRERLRRRGLEVSAGLFAAALSASSTSAQVSATLTTATLRAALQVAAGAEPAAGLISAKVAALVQGATQTMFVTKAKIVTALFLAMSVGASALGITWRTALTAGAAEARQGDAAKLKAAAVPAVSARSAKPEPKQSTEIRGLVVDPEGKPFPGAKLYLATWTALGFTVEERATSGADGGFAFTFSKSERDRAASDNSWSQVVAIATGYGFDLAGVGEPGKEGGLTLRLVKDAPINGRVLDSDGKPVAGANVRLRDVQFFAGEDLTAVLDDIRKGGFGTPPAKGWSGPLPGHPREVSTGADGRFRLTGLGRERMAVLQIEGPAIHYTTIQVMTRAAETIVGPNPHRAMKIYGATFDYLADPSRPVRGVVRDKDTGKPIADIQISSYSTTHTTRTDKDGRYELLGCPKSNEYTVNVGPAAGQPYLASSFVFSDAPGLTPLTADIELVRGIALRGRLTEEGTGKPIAHAAIEYRPLYPSPYAEKAADAHSLSSSAQTGQDGAFSLVVLPGPGVIGAAARKRSAYTLALITPKEMQEFFKDSKNWTDAGNSQMSLLVSAGRNAAQGMAQENYNLLTLIEPAEKAGQLTYDLALRPARTVKGHVVGPDDKPLAGAIAYGLAPDHVFLPQTLTTDTFTVTGLNPRRSRPLLFYHKEQNLGFFKEIAGDEPEPLKVQLQPCGSATGRIVDKDGQPLPGLTLYFYRSSLIGPGGAQAETDKEGRFRVTGLAPGQTYWLMLANQPRVRVHADPFALKPGEARALGDLLIEPSR